MKKRKRFVYDVVGFGELVPVRFTADQLKLIKRIVKKDGETYENVSHFIRASVLRRIREERSRLKL
jgi:Arc/MetJ-type ribon-helix-helix transcriptional regulator